MSASLTNGSQNGAAARTATKRSLDADIALLGKLLSDDVDESDPNIEELLKRLEAAEGLADGVESRLDAMIGGLDQLLSDLEPVPGEAGRVETREAGSQVEATKEAKSDTVGHAAAEKS